MAVPTTAELQSNTYKRGTKVRLVDDIPGRPAGSAGKVALANGMTWKRYWVRFPDGQAVGHVDHGLLVRAKDYDTFIAAREREAIEAEHMAELATETTASSGESGAAAGGVEVNGVAVPQLLLDRSAAVRARLGA